MKLHIHAKITIRTLNTPTSVTSTETGFTTKHNQFQPHSHLVNLNHTPQNVQSLIKVFMPQSFNKPTSTFETHLLTPLAQSFIVTALHSLDSSISKTKHLRRQPNKTHEPKDPIVLTQAPDLSLRTPKLVPPMKTRKDQISDHKEPKRKHDTSTQPMHYSESKLKAT